MLFGIVYSIDVSFGHRWTVCGIQTVKKSRQPTPFNMVAPAADKRPQPRHNRIIVIIAHVGKRWDQSSAELI